MHVVWMRSVAPLFLLVALLIGCRGNHTPPVATPTPIVEVARPIEQDVTDYETFTARTQAVQSIDIKARVTGFVTGLGFKDGGDVTVDQVLFEIDDRPYKAALDKAKGDVEVAKANLIKQQAYYDIGIGVQKQNPAAISEQELERRKGGRDEALGSVKQALASQATAQLNFDWCKVKSPIAGRINRHFVDVGDLISENITLLTNVVSLKPMWAYFDVDQNSMESYETVLREGKVVSPRTGQLPIALALGSNPAFSYSGTVDFVSNQLDPGTGSIRLRGVFPNEDGKLVAGLFTRVRVPSSSPHSALLVSDRAIGTGQGQRFVLVVNDKNEVEYRVVQVGQMHGELREVYRKRRIVEAEGGVTDTVKEVEVLKATDRLIVNGLQRVRPGDKVEPKLVDMNTLLDADKTPAPAKPKK
ncbi:MAG: efflux RND transporter periplasmic adaptor subunit [Planctomycetes bacterium]|nr:efflux RND transporter periplasmic adaptor subunit [Planctomycetota bacterium]